MPRSPADEELDRIEALAAEEAKEIVAQIDQLSLIDYPIIQPDHLAVIEVVIRHRLIEALVSEVNRSS